MLCILWTIYKDIISKIITLIVSLSFIIFGVVKCSKSIDAKRDDIEHPVYYEITFTNSCRDTIIVCPYNYEYYKDWYLNQHPKMNYLEEEENIHHSEKIKIISFLRNMSGDDEWFKFHDEFSRRLKELPGKELWCDYH